ncbi:hypothetical protein [Microbacterium sp.]|uniref:hypothetical protein n=1 Tax=Microbacterium sp. TaxID=51671 RepID=UPI002FDF4E9C
MGDRQCAACGAPINLARADARTCSAKCRKRMSRKPAYTSDLIGLDRWVRWALVDGKKKPLTIDGWAASSTNADTWSSYLEAKRSSIGTGLGFVLAGDGIGCYDLDHVIVDGELMPAAQRFLDQHPGWLVEISPSGEGLHVWVYAESQPGWRRAIDGISVEFYTRGRYMTMTGDRYQQ